MEFSRRWPKPLPFPGALFIHLSLSFSLTPSTVPHHYNNPYPYFKMKLEIRKSWCCLLKLLYLILSPRSLQKCLLSEPREHMHPVPSSPPLKSSLAPNCTVLGRSWLRWTHEKPCCFKLFLISNQLLCWPEWSFLDPHPTISLLKNFRWLLPIKVLVSPTSCSQPFLRWYPKLTHLQPLPQYNRHSLNSNQSKLIPNSTCYFVLPTWVLFFPPGCSF